MSHLEAKGLEFEKNENTAYEERYNRYIPQMQDKIVLAKAIVAMSEHCKTPLTLTSLVVAKDILKGDTK